MGRLSRPSDEVFERVVAKLVKDGAEVQVECGTSSAVGFIAGLDESWIHLIDSETGKSRVVSIDQLNVITETGSYLSSVQSGVKQRVAVMTRVSKAFLEGG